MKPLTSTVAAVALAVGLSSAASAEPFNGPYVGAQVGWSQDDLGSGSRDNIAGGLYAGYDVKASPDFVIGVEGGVQLGADDEIARSTSTGRIEIDPKRSFDLTARAGYLARDDTLVYARGGYANARVRTSVQDAAGFRSASSDRDGWLLGGGVEHALSDNVSARAEYRYSDFGEDRGKFDRHQALFGISYRF